MLQGVLARRETCPRVNLVVAEIQLLLNVTDHVLVAEHVWSERNEICDALSRGAEGKERPSAVSEAARATAVKDVDALLGVTSEEIALE